MRWLFYTSIFVFLLPAIGSASALVMSGIAPADSPRHLQLSLGDLSDCSNSTHRWSSRNGSCFDEESGPIPFTPSVSKPNIFARYLSDFVGLRPREGFCGPQETTCWIVNCCQPGETCGSIEQGCLISWSTIYTTTTTTLWSTITSWVTPQSNTLDYTTVTVNSTQYVTSFNQITLPGRGVDVVIDTDVVTTSKLVLSAFTPPAVTTTQTITDYNGQPAVTAAPRLMIRQTGTLLSSIDAPRRSARTSYTTLTVYISSFFTTSTTATLSNSIVEVTETRTISSVATRNQTHYQTPTGFTTLTVTATSTSTSYAYGTVDPPTQVLYVTTVPSPIIAGITPSDTKVESTVAPQSGPKGLSQGVIAGIVVGLLLALILIALVAIFVCLRRRKRRRDEALATEERDIFDETPSPPAAPSPKPAMTSISQTEITVPGPFGWQGDSPVSPTSELFFSGLNMTDDKRYNQASYSNGGVGSSRQHARRGSRGSVVSTILPVPEEDEDEITPVNAHTLAAGSSSRKSSMERNWGRGFGGRGGYNNLGNGNRSRENVNKSGTESPTNPAFRGVITSAYNEGGLVPPHARDHGFRF